MVYKIFDIKWDTNGDKVKLPNELLWECDKEFDIEKLGKYELSFYIGYDVKQFAYEEY